jgi:hypothetical protein
MRMTSYATWLRKLCLSKATYTVKGFVSTTQAVSTDLVSGRHYNNPTLERSTNDSTNGNPTDQLLLAVPCLMSRECLNTTMYSYHTYVLMSYQCDQHMSISVCQSTVSYMVSYHKPQCKPHNLHAAVIYAPWQAITSHFTDEGI